MADKNDELIEMMDECGEMVKAFANMFEPTAEGRVRLMIATDLLMGVVAKGENIPVQHLHKVIPILASKWIEVGKPRDFGVTIADHTGDGTGD